MSQGTLLIVDRKGNLIYYISAEQRGALEVFHSSLLKYAPKRQCFSYRVWSREQTWPSCITMRTWLRNQSWTQKVSDRIACVWCNIYSDYNCSNNPCISYRKTCDHSRMEQAFKRMGHKKEVSAKHGQFQNQVDAVAVGEAEWSYCHLQGHIFNSS